MTKKVISTPEELQERIDKLKERRQVLKQKLKDTEDEIIATENDFIVRNFRQSGISVNDYFNKILPETKPSETLKSDNNSTPNPTQNNNSTSSQFNPNRNYPSREEQNK